MTNNRRGHKLSPGGILDGGIIKERTDFEEGLFGSKHMV
jgi:hypothetical protein